ncbi:hypothetical protein IAR50_003982 [Cryptococcus sp. DSM 104548]
MALPSLPLPSPYYGGSSDGSLSNLIPRPHSTMISSTSSFGHTSSTFQSTAPTKRLSTSATTNSLAKRGSVMKMGEDGGVNGGVSMERECASLRKTNEGLNKTNNSLRARVSELESFIEQATGPEVERLSEEVLTLEELLSVTQRDNEAKWTENEKQKQYLKDLENLLGTLAGPSWRIDHSIPAPSVPTTNTCASSTPLPKTKPKKLSNSLRHSVSFSSGRPALKLHRRASSTMEFSSMMASVGPGAGLGAVEEMGESGSQDSTPTGALRRLNGGRSVSAMLNTTTSAKGREAKGREAKGTEAKGTEAKGTEDIMGTLSLPPVSGEKASEGLPDKGGKSEKDMADQQAQLSKLLHLLSSIDPTTISSLGGGLREQQPSRDAKKEEVTRGERERCLLQNIFDEQERRLTAREERLDRLVQTVRVEQAKYDTRV